MVIGASGVVVDVTLATTGCSASGVLVRVRLRTANASGALVHVRLSTPSHDADREVIRVVLLIRVLLRSHLELSRLMLAMSMMLVAGGSAGDWEPSWRDSCEARLRAVLQLVSRSIRFAPMRLVRSESLQRRDSL